MVILHREKKKEAILYIRKALPHVKCLGTLRVLAFESVMSEKLRAPKWVWVLGLQKRQDYLSGISHFGAFPKVWGCGWEEAKCSLQWHLDLGSASWIKHWTTAEGDAGAVRRIPSSHTVLSGAAGS